MAVVVVVAFMAAAAVDKEGEVVAAVYQAILLEQLLIALVPVLEQPQMVL